ncbi:alpha/beta fold hydrolase [Acidicapsa ligni]|uniref:alpha/beta fold hydrolase n=1 Tax=Acidicapsa ligni TaxID=542300 RepID=UPI0021DFFE4F|nr:alpha/beta hydrolase [Acidicapsa ligni]
MVFFVSLICCAAALASAGFLYQWFGAHRDRRLYAGLGRWISIGNGCKLYMLEKGSGGPTVLFEAGIAATNLNWCHIQDMVSEFTHTASYDRGGLGWSSPSNTVRTPGNIAIELNAMLEAAGIKPPYVLVGHSFGGLVMRRYALLYPENVAGIILVDPMRCEEWPPLNPEKQALLDRGAKLSGYAVPIARSGLARLAVTSLLCRSGRLSTFLAGAAGKGGMHVLGRIKSEVGKMPEAVWPIVAAHWSRPGYYVGMSDHIVAVPDTVREMQNAEPIFGIPILLLTPITSSPLTDECLACIGDNIQQVIAPESEHWIHLDEPDLVIDSIREMVMATSSMTVEVIA